MIIWLSVESLTDAGQNPTTIIQYDAGQNPTTIIQYDAGQNPTTIIQFDAGQNPNSRSMVRVKILRI